MLTTEETSFQIIHFLNEATESEKAQRGSDFSKAK